MAHFFLDTSNEILELFLLTFLSLSLIIFFLSLFENLRKFKAGLDTKRREKYGEDSERKISKFLSKESPEKEKKKRRWFFVFIWLSYLFAFGYYAYPQAYPWLMEPPGYEYDFFSLEKSGSGGFTAFSESDKEKKIKRERFT